MMETTILAQIGGVSGATIALIQFVIKPLLSDKRWVPLCAVAISVVLTLAVGYSYGKPLSSVDLVTLTLEGLVSGVGAIGAFSGVKNTVQP